jgi:hypothetical protein
MLTVVLATGAYKRLTAEAANDSVALAKFRAFENAWIKYRDAYLDAAFPAEDKSDDPPRKK